MLRRRPLLARGVSLPLSFATRFCSAGFSQDTLVSYPSVLGQSLAVLVAESGGPGNSGPVGVKFLERNARRILP